MNELFALLPALLETFPANTEVREAVVFAAWRRAAGTSLRTRAVPTAFEARRLTVAVENNTWKRQLEGLAGEMLFKLNRTLGGQTVEFIEFTIDAEALQNYAARHHTADANDLSSEPLPEIGPEIRRSADAIKDENLRKLFLNAAEKCMRRSKFYGRT